MREYRDVFAVGHCPRTQRGRWMGAVLACGPGAVLAFRAGGALWEVRASDALDVLIPHGRRIVVPGVTVRRSRTLRPEDCTVLDGIPVTTLARTMADLSTVLHGRALERALGEARFRGLTELAGGTPELRALAAAGTAETSRTRTRGEEALLRALRAAGAPEPLVNVPLPGTPWTPDLYWPAQALVVEIDGGSHTLPGRATRDAIRDADLRSRGIRTHRIPDAEAQSDPHGWAMRVTTWLAEPPRAPHPTPSMPENAPHDDERRR